MMVKRYIKLEIQFPLRHLQIDFVWVEFLDTCRTRVGKSTIAYGLAAAFVTLSAEYTRHCS